MIDRLLRRRVHGQRDDRLHFLGAPQRERDSRAAVAVVVHQQPALGDQLRLQPDLVPRGPGAGVRAEDLRVAQPRDETGAAFESIIPGQIARASCNRSVATYSDWFSASTVTTRP